MKKLSFIIFCLSTLAIAWSIDSFKEATYNLMREKQQDFPKEELVAHHEGYKQTGFAGAVMVKRCFYEQSVSADPYGRFSPAEGQTEWYPVGRWDIPSEFCYPSFDTDVVYQGKEVLPTYKSVKKLLKTLKKQGVQPKDGVYELEWEGFKKVGMHNKCVLYTLKIKETPECLYYGMTCERGDVSQKYELRRIADFTDHVDLWVNTALKMSEGGRNDVEFIFSASEGFKRLVLSFVVREDEQIYYSFAVESGYAMHYDLGGGYECVLGPYFTPSMHHYDKVYRPEEAILTTEDQVSFVL